MSRENLLLTLTARPARARAVLDRADRQETSRSCWHEGERDHCDLELVATLSLLRELNLRLLSASDVPGDMSRGQRPTPGIERGLPKTGDLLGLHLAQQLLQRGNQVLPKILSSVEGLPRVDRLLARPPLQVVKEMFNRIKPGRVRSREEDVDLHPSSCFQDVGVGVDRCVVEVEHDVLVVVGLVGAEAEQHRLDERLEDGGVNTTLYELGGYDLVLADGRDETHRVLLALDV